MTRETGQGCTEVLFGIYQSRRNLSRERRQLSHHLLFIAYSLTVVTRTHADDEHDHGEYKAPAARDG